jgi:hypothetical protein
MGWFENASRLLMKSRRPAVEKPIFIVGCGRSGTTLLFDLLSTHPGLERTTGYPDGEDHEGWVRHGKCVMAGIGNVHHSAYGNGINGHHYCMHMSMDDVTPQIVAEMHAYYLNDVLCGRSGARVINKQPHLSNKLQYVLGIFPDAKIVHIVRDCEPLVSSWLAVMDDHPTLSVYWPGGEAFPCFWLLPKPVDPVAASLLGRHPGFYPGGGAGLWIDYWRKVNAGIALQMSGRERQLLSVRYEDLIKDPQEVLAKITRFCELPAFDYITDRIEKNTALKHHARMTPELRASIFALAGPVLRQFGYNDGTSSRRGICDK